MPIRWLKATFGLDPADPHISSPREQRFLDMAKKIAGTDTEVAVYVPEGVLPVYPDTPKFRGRIVGSVRLLPMPPGKKPEDFNWLDYDRTNRWPIGWPCEVMTAPEPERCPRLRELVAELFPNRTLAEYTGRLESGPFPLEDKMWRKLEPLLIGQPKRPSRTALNRSVGFAPPAHSGAAES